MNERFAYIQFSPRGFSNEGKVYATPLAWANKLIPTGYYGRTDGGWVKRISRPAKAELIERAYLAQLAEMLESTPVAMAEKTGISGVTA